MPITATAMLKTFGLVVGAASSVASFAKESSQANYHQALANESARQKALEQKAFANSYTEKAAAERINQMNTREANATKEQHIQADALRKQGSMLASSNTSGMALDSLMNDFMRQEAADKEQVRQNTRHNTIASEAAISGYRNNAQNSITIQGQYVAPPSKSPSGLGLALSLGKTGIGIANTFVKGK